MKELRDLVRTMPSSFMNDPVMAEHCRIIADHHRAEQQKAYEKAYLKQQEIEASTNFRISLTRMNKIGLEEFYIEDYKTAVMIYEKYKETGLEIKLKTVTLWINEDDKVRKCNFKY